jgi:hypothetical protein
MVLVNAYFDEVIDFIEMSVTRKHYTIHQSQTLQNRVFGSIEQDTYNFQIFRGLSCLHLTLLPVLQKTYDYFGKLDQNLSYTYDNRVTRESINQDPTTSLYTLVFEINLMTVITQKEFSLQAGFLIIGSLSVVVRIVHALARNLLRNKYINSQADTVRKIECHEEINKKKSCCKEVKELFCLLDKESRKKLGERTNYAALYLTSKSVENYETGMFNIQNELGE